MALKNFRVTNGISIESSGIPTSIIQETVTSNSATEVDTVALSSFVSCEYTVTLAQGSKVRTSKVFMQTDGTSVDMTEFGIIETGGTMSGVVISATTASTNAILQLTVTDASSTIVRYKIVKNILSSISYISDAPTIGTATASAAVAGSSTAQASVTFTQPIDNGGQAISSFTVTSSPGNITASGASSPISITGLTQSTAYTFTVTATNANGTSAASAASNSITTSGPPVYALGDTGPGGGKIFYVAPTGTTFAGGPTLNLTCTYLEAAPTSGTNAWVDDYFYWSGDTSTFIGTITDAIGIGYKNTLAMVAQNATAGKAGTSSRAYRGPNNLNDWFLPSRLELDKLYLNRSYVDALISSSSYSSSSEIDSSTPTRIWILLSSNGNITYTTKGAYGPRVRPIRAF